MTLLLSLMQGQAIEGWEQEEETAFLPVFLFGLAKK